MSGPMPTEIERVGEREIRVTWDDGKVTVYKNTDLRFACACAMCVEEFSGERLIRREQVPEDIRPTAMELVGNYAIQITWSDGHATGIFSFDYLRELAT